MSTLTFPSPATVLPRIVEQLHVDIDPSAMNALSELDFAIWATPEGSTYIDGKFVPAVVNGALINECRSFSVNER